MRLHAEVMCPCVVMGGWVGARYDITTTANFEHFMGRIQHGAKNGTDRVDLVRVQERDGSGKGLYHWHAVTLSARSTDGELVS